jgi:hypothetical protein
MRPRNEVFHIHRYKIENFSISHIDYNYGRGMAEDLNSLCILHTDGSKISFYFDTFDICQRISSQAMSKLNNTTKESGERKNKCNLEADGKLLERSENTRTFEFFRIYKLSHTLGKQFPSSCSTKQCFSEHVPPYPPFLTMAEAQHKTQSNCD